jgi:hypothetical protein
MMYPQGGLLGRSTPSRFIGAFASAVAAMALIALVTGIALYSVLPEHQTANRRAKADASVSLSELRAKLALKVACIRFFHDRQLAAPQALNQFVGAETAGEVSKYKPSEIVAITTRDAIAW